MLCLLNLLAILYGNISSSWADRGRTHPRVMSHNSILLLQAHLQRHSSSIGIGVTLSKSPQLCSIKSKSSSSLVLNPKLTLELCLVSLPLRPFSVSPSPLSCKLALDAFGAASKPGTSDPSLSDRPEDLAFPFPLLTASRCFTISNSLSTASCLLSATSSLLTSFFSASLALISPSILIA